MSRTDAAETNEAQAAEAAESMERPSKPVLWFALAAGVAAWMVHLTGGAALVPAACTHDLSWSIDVLTVAMAAVCIAGAMVAWRITQRFSGSEDSRAEGYRILGFVGLVANVGSLALVIGEGLMHGWIGACQ